MKINAMTQNHYKSNTPKEVKTAQTSAQVTETRQPISPAFAAKFKKGKPIEYIMSKIYNSNDKELIKKLDTALAKLAGTHIGDVLLMKDLRKTNNKYYVRIKNYTQRYKGKTYQFPLSKYSLEEIVSVINRVATLGTKAHSLIFPPSPTLLAREKEAAEKVLSEKIKKYLV